MQQAMFDIIIPTINCKDAGRGIATIQPLAAPPFLRDYLESATRQRGILSLQGFFLQMPISPQILLAENHEMPRW